MSSDVTATFRRYKDVDSDGFVARRIYTDDAVMKVPPDEDTILGYVNVSEAMAENLGLDPELIEVTITGN